MIVDSKVAIPDTGGAVSTHSMALAAPAEVLAVAQAAARALKGVLDQKPDKVMMNGQQYLEYEDWQTIGQFYGYTVQTHDAVAVDINGVQGAKASADLVEFRTGLVVGHAEAYCMRDEDKWNTRAKYEWRDVVGGKRERVHIGDEPVPWFQLASMAQTRAAAKAFRNRLAWVVVLAGYKATPAEELPESERTANKPSGAPSTEHWCAKHNAAYFKRGKMTGYAHPIKDDNGNDTGEWCRESSPKNPAPQPQGNDDIPPNPASPSPSTGGASTVQAPTPAARPVPAGGQPGKPAQAVLAKAEPASAPPDAEWDGLPSAAHPSAPAGMAPAFANWGDVASWCLDHTKLSMTDFLGWAGQHLGRKIGAWPSFGDYATAVVVAREYVAAQKEV